jgi:archaetidylinositol phosphate synthase
VAHTDFVRIGTPPEVGARGPAARFEPSNRIQTNILAGGERALLDRLCRVTPDWVTPDRLTAVGMLGALVSSIGYIASNWGSGFLFLASLGLLMNWLGDSLDGSLARHRKAERPRYGFYLDHSVDAISNLILVVGLGLSPYVRLDAALFLLASYYLLSMHVFLTSHVSGEFRLSFVYGGPTELRLLTIAFNLFMYIEGPFDLRFGGATVSLYTLLVAFEGVVFLTIFISAVLHTARKLRRQDERAKIWRYDRRVPNRG